MVPEYRLALLVGNWIWGQAISASVPYGLTKREEFGHLTPGRGSWETNRAPSVKPQATSLTSMGNYSIQNILACRPVALFKTYTGQNKERKIMSKVSPMSDEFHDWLESCPVQWFRGEVSKDHVAYYFETPDEDEEEN